MATTKSEAEREARDIVHKWAVGAALTGWIPGSSLFLIEADEMMAQSVAKAFGVDFDKAELTAQLGSIARSVAGGIVAEGVGLIPGVGWVAKSGIMTAKAKLIGESTIEYFRERSTLPDELNP